MCNPLRNSDCSRFAGFKGLFSVPHAIPRPRCFGQRCLHSMGQRRLSCSTLRPGTRRISLPMNRAIHLPAMENKEPQWRNHLSSARPSGLPLVQSRGISQRKVIPYVSGESFGKQDGFPSRWNLARRNAIPGEDWKKLRQDHSPPAVHWSTKYALAGQCAPLSGICGSYDLRFILGVNSRGYHKFLFEFVDHRPLRTGQLMERFYPNKGE